jgi:N6-L-threonylcarbamoyladenine synthase
MRILGIESSCDETAIAIVNDESGRLLVEKSIVLSQIQIHEQYGGVVPEVAARQHLKAIFPMLRAEIASDGEGIDAIAVTAGPGLAPALRTGVEVAKTLAWSWEKPLLGVSHMEGHIYASWLQGSTKSEERSAESETRTSNSELRAPDFPLLCLIVSGGHTELVLMKDHGMYERLGETLDDAAGEAFDKTAKMLGLSYPGGPAIQALAENGDDKAFDFPRGLLNRPDLNFSFSGLKTSVLYTLRKEESWLNDPQFRANIAASLQEAIVDVLVRKTMRAVKRISPAGLVVAGGVSANTLLRERLAEKAAEHHLPFHLPPLKYSLDNAAMIAAVGYFRAKDEANFVDPLTLVADSNLDVFTG